MSDHRPQVVVEPLHGTQGNRIGFKVYDYRTKRRYSFKNSAYGGNSMWWKAKEAAQSFAAALEREQPSNGT